MRTLYFCPVVSFFFFYSSPNLSRWRLDVYRTSTQPWCGLSANLGCTSETCCTRLAGNTGRKKVAKNRSLKMQDAKMTQKSPSGQPTTLSGYIFATKARIDNRKNLLNSNTFSTCPRNMAIIGPLATEIVSLVCGTPANFNGFRVLAALLHGTLVLGVSQTASLNRGRHLYSAGRPSRWALGHISSLD